VPDRDDSTGLVRVGQVVEETVGPDPERPEAAQSTAEGVPGGRIALKEAEGFLGGVDERPVELQ